MSPATPPTTTITDSTLFQVSSSDNFIPEDQTASRDNDNQCNRALTAILAAEDGFPEPPSDQPQWLELARNVFEVQPQRISNEACGGGLRWQIFPFNAGYDYKDSKYHCPEQPPSPLVKHSALSLTAVPSRI
ncbi:glycosyl hydrolase family 76-domain-containing protein [Stachybotrys elegans]|uniref:mannan endo-1,6-alpha-mannosidase n=1 Tax=Stachybotrys elegans TaxID=80388 RepID=A0A8K0SIQ5_9HYPO|nr:glycosyl hydrolase family 76-domain-containing protein [Stachybotrys elegans]